MNIVVLDGHTLNPGDLSWDALRKLGPCEIYERSGPDEIVPRAANAAIVLTNKVVLNKAFMAAVPQLKYIGVTATGYNIVDVAAARERNIVVTNVPTYGTRSVAQMTFALLLELTQHVGHHAQTVRDGRWSRSPDFCYWDYPLVELDGLTMGIVGYGRIGQAVGELAQAFGMNVIAHSRKQSAEDLERLFRASDVISLHCPLTPETRHLVNARRLGWMKPGSHRRRRFGRSLRRTSGGGQSFVHREELFHYSSHRLGHSRSPLAADGRGRGERPGLSLG
jgi:glycerate dehydrogenase